MHDPHWHTHVHDLVSQLLMVASPIGAHSLPAVWLVAVASKYEHEPVLTLLATGRERTVLEQERSPCLAMKDHASDTSNTRHKTTVGKSFISKEARSQLFQDSWAGEELLKHSSGIQRLPSLKPHAIRQKNWIELNWIDMIGYTWWRLVSPGQSKYRSYSLF